MNHLGQGFFLKNWENENIYAFMYFSLKNKNKLI